MTMIPPPPPPIDPNEESGLLDDVSVVEKTRTKFSKRKIAEVTIVADAVAVAALVLFQSSSNGPDDSNAPVVLANFDDEKIDYLQIGSSNSVEKILDGAGKIRLEDVSQIQVLSDGFFSVRNYVSLQNGDVALSYTHKDRTGLSILKGNSESVIELVEPDYFSISTYYSANSSKFFVTVIEENRSRCLLIDLKGNQTQLGRGYCKLLTSDLVLVIEKDDDTNKVTVRTFDAEGMEVEKVEVELSDFGTTPSGDLYYGFSENSSGDSLLTVLKSSGLKIWQTSPEALETSVVDVLNNGLVVAVDEGDEIARLNLITANSDAGIITTVAEGEKVSSFSSTDRKTLYVSAASQDSEFDEWKVFSINSQDEPIGKDFYSGELTTMYFIPESQTILGWNSNSSELLIGTEEEGLTYLSDFDAPISQLFIMQNQVYLLSDGELWNLNESEQDVDKLEENIALVIEVASGNSNVFVFKDDNDNYRLVRLLDGELVEIDEDGLIGGLVTAGSSKLYYSTGDEDGSNMEFNSIDLSNEPGKQRSKVSKRLANDAMVIPELLDSGLFLEPRERSEVVANIDSRRRACKDEGLQILESGDSTTFEVLPTGGSYFCISVSDRDLESFTYFGLEVSSEIDLEMEVFQDDDVLYAGDDQVGPSGRIVSYDPTIINMDLVSGTYRVHLFPHEDNSNLGVPSRVTFTGSEEYVESETSTSTSASVDSSTSGCDVIMNPFDSLNFEIGQDSKVICFIQDPSAAQDISIQNLGAYDGQFLDVTLNCETYSDTTYNDYDYIFYYIEAGKGVDRCEISETYAGDGSYGEVSVSMSYYESSGEGDF
jgi:hypothetical protein